MMNADTEPVVDPVYMDPVHVKSLCDAMTIRVEACLNIASLGFEEDREWLLQGTQYIVQQLERLQNIPTHSAVVRKLVDDIMGGTTALTEYLCIPLPGCIPLSVNNATEGTLDPEEIWERQLTDAHDVD